MRERTVSAVLGACLASQSIPKSHVFPFRIRLNAETVKMLGHGMFLKTSCPPVLAAAEQLLHLPFLNLQIHLHPTFLRRLGTADGSHVDESFALCFLY